MNIRIRISGTLATAAFVAAACSTTGGTLAPSTASVRPNPAEAVTPTALAYPPGDFELTLWTSEGESGGGYQFVSTMADSYAAIHPNVSFDVVGKGTAALADEFVTSSLAGAAPEVLWTVPDHLGTFVAADLLVPLDDVIDASTYQAAAAGAATLEGRLWGAPVSLGGHLMLYWNKELVGDGAPLDTDALVARAKGFTTGDRYGLVFDQTDSLWLFPWLGGFGGMVFAADGVTPTLDTEAMRGTLQFMYDLKYADRVMPPKADGDAAARLFRDGKAGMIVDGDWALNEYAEALGDSLGLGALPLIVGHGDPQPYVSGAFMMASNAVGDPDISTIVADFIRWVTAPAQQLDMVSALGRLPGNSEALADPIVAGDARLGASAAAAQKGIGRPANLGMRCVFDAVTAGVRDLYTGNGDVAGIASTMQVGAETCIQGL